MNDYIAAYHDAVLLIGQVMRDIVRQNHSHIHEMEYVNVNYFRNISFNGRQTAGVALVKCSRVSPAAGGQPTNCLLNRRATQVDSDVLLAGLQAS